MKACTDYEALIIDCASGDLDAQGRETLEGHLWRCAGCTAALAATRETLGRVALPPVSARELALQEGLAPRVRTALRQAEHRRVWVRGALAGLVAAAAAVLLFVVPRALSGPDSPFDGAREPGPLAAEVEAWALSEPLHETFADPSDVAKAPGEGAALDSETTVDLYLNPGE